MAIAFDATSSISSDTGNLSWTHTPVGTPRGVVVQIVQNVGTTDEVTGVTYGGVAMARVTGATVFHTTGSEDGAVYTYFLGSGLPTGAQTVTVTVTGTGSNKDAAACTVTAAANTEVNTSGTLDSGGTTNPSVSLTTTVETFVMAALHSGVNSAVNLSPGANFTELFEENIGANQVASFERRTTNPAAGSVTVDWVCAISEESGIGAVAIQEVIIIVDPPPSQRPAMESSMRLLMRPRRAPPNEVLKTDVTDMEDRFTAQLQYRERHVNRPPQMANRSQLWNDLEPTFIVPEPEGMPYEFQQPQRLRPPPPKTRSILLYGAEPSLFPPPEPTSPDKWDSAPAPARLRPHPRFLFGSAVYKPTSTEMPGIVILFGDSLRFFLTGAASDGGSQSAQTASLGNYRASTEADRVGRIYSRPLRNISIVQASRNNGTDGATGSITTTSDSFIRYSAPGSGTPGPSTSIALGQTVVLTDGADPSKWLRVQRTGSTALSGFGNVEFDDQFNNVFGLSNSANAESVAGGNRYRGVMIRNDATPNVTGIKFYIGTLGTAAVSSAGQLSGAGAGTITFATNGCCDWPHQGWARIETSGGSLREIVYYSSRTDTALTVPSLGRSRLGTSAGAGAATDTVYPVPGIRIGFEYASPLVGGPVQTIANESTAPNTAAFIATAWSTARTAAAGISVGTLTQYQQGALWIHRELPAGVTAFARHENEILCTFSVEGVAYSETLAGMYRIAVTASERYEIYWAIGSEPDISSTPNETTTTLPYTTTATFSLADDVRIVTQARNRYGMRTDSLDTTRLKLGGTPPPSPPTFISFAAGAGGIATAKFVYFYDIDATDVQADQWLVYLTSSGIDPVPGVDVPVITSIVKVDGGAVLTHVTTGYTAGTTLKIIVRVRRLADTVASENTDVHSVTVDTTGPATVSASVHWRSVAEQDQ